MIQSFWFWSPETISSRIKEGFMKLGCEESMVDKDLANIVNYKSHPEKWREIVLGYSGKKFNTGQLMLINP